MYWSAELKSIFGPAGKSKIFVTRDCVLVSRDFQLVLEHRIDSFPFDEPRWVLSLIMSSARVHARVYGDTFPVFRRLVGSYD